MRRARVPFILIVAPIAFGACIPVEPSDDAYGGLEVVQTASASAKQGFVTDDGWRVTLDNVLLPLTAGLNRYNANATASLDEGEPCVGELFNVPRQADNLLSVEQTSLTKRVDVGRCVFVFETSVVSDDKQVASTLLSGKAVRLADDLTMTFRFLLSLGGAPYGCAMDNGRLVAVTIERGEKFTGHLTWNPEELFRDGAEAQQGRLRFGPIAIADSPTYSDENPGGNDDGVVTQDELDALEIATVRRYGMPFDARTHLPGSIHMLSFVAGRGTLAWSLSSGEKCYSLDRTEDTVDPFE